MNRTKGTRKHGEKGILLTSSLSLSVTLMLLSLPSAHALTMELTCMGEEATIVGTEGPDEINGTPGDDVIVALGGDDRIKAHQGEDRICAGDGNDFVKGADGYDRIEGGAGDDTLYGGKRPDYFYPGPGDDRIHGGYEYGYGYGGGYSGNYWDWIVYTDLEGIDVDLTVGYAKADGHDTVSDVEGVIGSKGDDVVRGGESSDSLYGGPGDDTLIGLAGDDHFVGGDGDDGLDGGEGRDSLAFREDGEDIPGPVRVDLGRGTTIGHGSDTVNSIEVVSGTTGNDILIGDKVANVLKGLGGEDEIDGSGGNDTLIGDESFGAPQRDVIRGGSGRDRLFGGPGPDDLDGGSGHDVMGGTSATRHVVTVPCTDKDDDLIDGGTGNDLVTYFACRHKINVHLGREVARGAGNDKVIEIEKVEAGARAFGRLVGTDDDETFKVSGGTGSIDAGDGTDTLIVNHARTKVDLRNGSLRLQGNESTIEGIENVTTSYMDDVLIGDEHDNVLKGGEGYDTVLGGRGDDTLIAGDPAQPHTGYEMNSVKGGRGNDSIIGGPGADRLTGGLGDDQLRGGRGNDHLDGSDGRDKLSGGSGRDECINGEKVNNCEEKEEPPTPAPVPTSEPTPLPLPTIPPRSPSGNDQPSLDPTHTSLIVQRRWSGPNELPEGPGSKIRKKWTYFD